MGTTADIGRLNPDGTITTTHISGDGYLAGAGAILLTSYSTPEAQEKLWPKYNGTCVEEWHEDPEVLSFLEPDEYGGDWQVAEDDLSYLWKDGQWFYRDWDADEVNGAYPLLPLTRQVILQSADDYFGQEGVDRITEYLDGQGTYSGA